MKVDHNVKLKDIYSHYIGNDFRLQYFETVAKLHFSSWINSTDPFYKLSYWNYGVYDIKLIISFEEIKSSKIQMILEFLKTHSGIRLAHLIKALESIKSVVVMVYAHQVSWKDAFLNRDETCKKCCGGNYIYITPAIKQ